MTRCPGCGRSGCSRPTLDCGGEPPLVEPKRGDRFGWPDPTGDRPPVPMVVTSVQTRWGHRYVYAISARQYDSGRPDRGMKPVAFSLREWHTFPRPDADVA